MNAKSSFLLVSFFLMLAGCEQGENKIKEERAANFSALEYIAKDDLVRGNISYSDTKLPSVFFNDDVEDLFQEVLESDVVHQDEFETKEEHALRKKAFLDSLRNRNGNVFVFEQPSYLLRYDADKQAYKVNINSTYHLSHSLPDGHVGEKIDCASFSKTTYERGVKILMGEIGNRDTNYKLAYKCKKAGGSYTAYIAVPGAVAKDLGDEISISFVGSLSEGLMSQNEIYRNSYGNSERVVYFYMENAQLWVYNKLTKEILGKYDFDGNAL